VDGGTAARSRDRGGDRIPSLRASRLRLAVAAVAVLLAGALGGLPLLGAGDAVPVLLLFGGLALAAVLVSLLWRPAPGFVLAPLAAAFLARELDGHVAAAATVAYAAGLLALCELLAWADTLRSPARFDPAYATRRAANLLAATGAGAATAGLTLAAGSVESPNAFVAGVAGAAAVVGLVAVVWRLGRGTA
jgi:hypothetical protein